MMKTIGENAVAMRTEIRDKENELSSKDEQIERLQECISTMWEQALPGRRSCESAPLQTFAHVPDLRVSCVPASCRPPQSVTSVSHRGLGAPLQMKTMRPAKFGEQTGVGGIERLINRLTGARGTGLPASTSAPGLGSLLPHLHRGLGGWCCRDGTAHALLQLVARIPDGALP